MAIGRYTGKSLGGNPGFSAGVENGRIPLSLLRRLETQPETEQFPASEQYLFRDAAIGLDAMVRAAEKDGVLIRLLEAYRTRARQDYFWDQYLHHGGNLAAKPGKSNHGMGVAIDVNRKGGLASALPWMREHADEYGWDLPDELGKKEPWHWEWIRNFGVASLPIAKPKPTPVYIHGQLIPGAFHSRNDAGSILVYLRPVVEELGWDVEKAEGQVVTLEQDGTGKKLNLQLTKTADGRAISPVRALCAKLGAPEPQWDGTAVRIQ